MPGRGCEGWRGSTLGGTNGTVGYVDGDVNGNGDGEPGSPITGRWFAPAWEGVVRGQQGASLRCDVVVRAAAKEKLHNPLPSFR